MKRKISMFLAILLTISLLVSCGGNTNNSTTDTSTTTDSTTTDTTSDTATTTDDADDDDTTLYATEDEISDTTQDIIDENITYTDAPMLQGKGLPPVEERIPNVPKLVNEMPADMLTYEVGKYGGTLRTVTSVVDWDADVFVANNEPLLNTPGIAGREVTGNVVAGYEASADQKEFIFHLRDGLKWSDGQPVTMEDFRFTIEDFLFNEELCPVFDNKYRAGGVKEGNPMNFEVIDDTTFKISFDEPYGGFLIRMAIVGWIGYTDILKPAHYMKKYHVDYATDSEKAEWDAIADEFGFAKDEKMWVNVFNKMDITNWELNRKEGIGFPKLYPWVLVSANQTTYMYERNPYYFKVDSAGQQLPYIDYIESTLVNDMEMVTLKVLSGEVDFCRESAALVNLPMYKENEVNGFRTVLSPMHVTPTDIMINQTYGDDQNYKDMVQDPRFRRALLYLLDIDEIVDTIYYGFAEPSTIVDARYAPEEAAALFEEMGMTKGADGYYLTPAGTPFEILIENGAEAPDIVPYCELITEMWRTGGVNANSKRIESSLVGNKQAANELQTRVIWTHTPLWYQMDWGFGGWGRAWDLWFSNTKEVEITLEDGSKTMEAVNGEEPPEDVKAFVRLYQSLMQVSVSEANSVFAQLKENMFEDTWYLTPIQNVRQPLIVRNTMKNVAENGFAIGVNFSLEQVWYDE